MSDSTNDIRERMQDVARYIQTILPPDSGFIFMAFDFTKEGQMGTFEYTSNADRHDVVTVLKNFINHTERQWMTHSKDVV